MTGVYWLELLLLITFCLWCLSPAEYTNDSAIFPPDVPLKHYIIKKCNLHESSRPVKKFDDPIMVEIKMFHLRLKELNERAEIFSVVLEFMLYWNNPCAKWNPSDWQNVLQIELRASQTWFPHLWHANPESDISLDRETRKENVLFNHTGQVLLQLRMAMSSYCPMRLRYFPFDTQICKIQLETLRMASWIRLDFQNGTKGFTNYFDEYAPFLSDSSIWHLRSLTTEKTNNAYSRIIYTFTLERNPATYVIEILIPTTAQMVSLILFVLISPEDTNRSIYCITVLLANTFLQGDVVDMIPRTSEIAYINIILSSQVLAGVTCTSYALLTLKLSKNFPRKSQHSKTIKICCFKKPVYWIDFMDVMFFMTYSSVSTILYLIMITRMILNV